MLMAYDARLIHPTALSLFTTKTMPLKLPRNSPFLIHAFMQHTDNSDEISQTPSENRADGRLRQGIVNPHLSRGQSSSIPRFPAVRDPATR